MGNWQLSSINLGETDLRILKSLLMLINDADRPGWDVTESGSGDALIIDLDVADGHATFRRFRERHSLIITCTQFPDDEAGEFQLTRPLRPWALSEVLQKVERRLGAEATPAGNTVYRLERWPPTEVLRRNRSLVRVCGALAHAPSSPGSVARRTGLGAEEMDALIRMLLANGCVVEDRDSADTLENVAPSVERSSLIGRLRTHLGRT